MVIIHVVYRIYAFVYQQLYSGNEIHSCLIAEFVNMKVSDLEMRFLVV